MRQMKELHGAVYHRETKGDEGVDATSDYAVEQQM